MKERLTERAYWGFCHWLLQRTTILPLLAEGEDEEEALNVFKRFSYFRFRRKCVAA